MCTPENGAVTVYEGDFDDVGMLLGKGFLFFTKREWIEGQFSGNILAGEVKISNAIYHRDNPMKSAQSPVTKLLVEYVDFRSPLILFHEVIYMWTM
ncbi:hypothetical protein AB6A40_011532 [Gnathostoma spinigerum]|uniref:Dirigent protein n=1 Tax=Gnathostoma spinigerum TaxID=75299 RepID=A0ABD6F3P4_9BILA